MKSGSALIVLLITLCICLGITASLVQRLCFEQDVGLQRSWRMQEQQAVIYALEYGIALVKELHRQQVPVKSGKIHWNNMPPLNKPVTIQVNGSADAIDIQATSGESARGHLLLKKKGKKMWVDEYAIL